MTVLHRTDKPLPAETILLVESDPLVLDMIREFLTRAGYRVLEAENGPEALALGEQQEEPIHLLIADITKLHMSGMNGPELAARLAGRYPRLQRLFMLDDADDRLLREMEAAGYRILQIPFSREELLDKVRDLLDKPLE